jgi:hypothetical protein
MPAWAKGKQHIQNNQHKMAGGMAQVVEHLPSGHEVLSPDTVLPKKLIKY